MLVLMRDKRGVDPGEEELGKGEGEEPIIRICLKKSVFLKNVKTN